MEAQPLPVLVPPPVDPPPPLSMPPVPVPVPLPLPVPVDVLGRPGRPRTGRFCRGSEVSVVNGAMPSVKEPDAFEKDAAARPDVPPPDGVEEAACAAWLSACANGRSWVMVGEASGGPPRARP